MRKVRSPHPALVAALTITFACGLAGTARAGADTRLPYGAVIAGGANHVLFVKPNGQLWAWGSNTKRQLGTTSTATSRVPVKTTMVDVVQVAAGSDFSLAIDGNAGLWSWGNNDKGQLGRTSTTLTPTKVNTANNWRSVGAGFNHAVGITIDGKLWGWGANGSSQLCRAATTSQTTPVQLGTDSDWIAAGAGLNFTVALKADGKLYGCGSNGSGQLNQGTLGGTKTSLTAMGTDRWVSFAVGTAHIVAIREDGTLWAWGLNDKGQIGNDGPFEVPSQALLSSQAWRAVAAGDRHSMAVKADGGAWGWGDNAYYQLGTNLSTGVFKAPIRIGTQINWELIAAGQGFGVAIKATGTLETWGRGDLLGIGSGVPNSHTSKFPQPAGELTTWYTFSKPGMLAAGTAFSAAIRSDGKLQTWGRNADGQLGNGNTSDVSSNWAPQVPAGVSTGPWLHIAAGEKHTVGVKADGTLWIWGGNDNGQQAVGVVGGSAQVPHQVGSGGWLKVFAHYAQTFALQANGNLYACGDNSMGQLGINRADGAQVSTLTAVTGSWWRAVGVAAHTTHFINARGELYGAGDGSGGGIGDGTNLHDHKVVAATRIGTGTSWVATAEGLGYGLALHANGRAYGWGSNSDGQLGNPNLGGGVTTPTIITTDRRYFHLAIAQKTALGVTTHGDVYGWGGNNAGEIVNGTVQQWVKSPVLSFFFNPRELVGGGQHFLTTCASGGARFAGGANDSGQLGTGSKGGFAADPLYITGAY